MNPPDGTIAPKRLVLRGHIWTLASLVPLLVRIIPLRVLAHLLTPPRWLRLYGGVSTDEIVARVMHRLRNPWHMRRRACLRQGLVIYHFLRLAGRRWFISACIRRRPTRSGCTAIAG